MNNKDFWEGINTKQKTDGDVLHTTAVKNIRGYIDSCNYISSEQFTVCGWLTDTTHGEIMDIRIVGGKITNYDFNMPRLDVTQYYKYPKLMNSGFLIHFTSPTNNNKIQIQVLLKNTKNWATVFDQELLPNRINIPSKISKINDNIPGLIVVDDFYTYPQEIRDIALTLDYNPSGYHKGKRTKAKLVLDGTKEKLERILGKEIIGWTAMHDHCGVFQHCTPADPIVYHYDGQTHAAVVFLTPDAPITTGTSFFRHKAQPWLDRAVEVGKNNITTEEERVATEQKYIGHEHDDFLDPTKWEEIDRIGNKFNRLAIWDARRIHAASQYFGKALHDSRLFHMFFFDVNN
jgi:hypothetical protein|tara:strand:- start:1414 stop:2451 length:1038 start_codon:yes stop_codon:yes gene_type:complete